MTAARRLDLPPITDAEIHDLAAGVAPRVFALVATDSDRCDAAVIAWGMAFGDDEFEVLSTLDAFRMTTSSMARVCRIFAPPPEDGDLHVVWTGEDHAIE